MDKPECRLCGHKHWSGEPHVFKETVAHDKARESRVEGPSDVKRRVKSGVPSESEVGKRVPSQSARNKRYRAKHPEKYREYMRDYMRRYRER